MEQVFQYDSLSKIVTDSAYTLDTPQRHPFYLIIYFHLATGHHTLDLRTYAIDPPSVIFITPEQFYQLQLEPGFDGHVLMFTEDFLMDFCMHATAFWDLELFFNCDEAPPLKLDQSYEDKVGRIIDDIQHEYTLQLLNWKTYVGALLKQFLVVCHRKKMEDRGPNAELSSRRAEIVRRFKRDLESYFKHHHKVSEYAALQQLSPVYINQVIKSETGQGAKEWILNRIMLEAKRHAAYTDKSLKEIAYSLGFDDPTHFSKQFKHHTQLPFSDFREQRRSKNLPNLTSKTTS